MEKFQRKNNFDPHNFGKIWNWKFKNESAKLISKSEKYRIGEIRKFYSHQKSCKKKIQFEKFSEEKKIPIHIISENFEIENLKNQSAKLISKFDKYRIEIGEIRKFYSDTHP